MSISTHLAAGFYVKAFTAGGDAAVLDKVCSHKKRARVWTCMGQTGLALFCVGVLYRTGAFFGE